VHVKGLKQSTTNGFEGNKTTPLDRWSDVQAGWTNCGKDRWHTGLQVASDFQKLITAYTASNAFLLVLGPTSKSNSTRSVTCELGLVLR
jgi:hypothetical protein